MRQPFFGRRGGNSTPEDRLLWGSRPMKQILVVFVLLLGAYAQTAPLVFGVHTNRLGSWPIQVPFDVWRSLNATSKSGSVKWSGIQTDANTYDFGTLDQAMQQAASANVAVIYTPYSTPSFIS